MKITKNNLIFSYKKPPLIVAEISGNHNGSKSRFLKLIETAPVNRTEIFKPILYICPRLHLNSNSPKSPCS